MESNIAAEEENQYDFDSLGISSSLQLVLQREGVLRPSRHQYCAIKSLLNSKSIVLQSKSGTGKTISFCIAIAQMIGSMYNDEDIEADVESADFFTDRKKPISYVNDGEEDSGSDAEVSAGDDVESFDSASIDSCSDGGLVSSEAPDSNNITGVSSGKLDDEGCLVNSAGKTRNIAIGDAVVLAPTRELATQIHDLIHRFLEPVHGVAVSLNVGGNDWKADMNYLVKTAPKIIVATPGRLRTLFKQIKRKSCTALSGDVKIYWNTQMVVLDEVDMLLDEQFFEQTRHICAKLVNPFVQVVAVSATILKFQFKIYEDMISSVDAQFKAMFLMSLQQDFDQTFPILKGSFSMHVAKCVRSLLMEGASKHHETNCESSGVSRNTSTHDDKEGSLEEGDSEKEGRANDESNIQTQCDEICIGSSTKYISVVKYLDEFVRDIKRIIVSASHVNRVALTSKDIICFTENDTIQDVQGMKQAIYEGGRTMVEMYDTPVLKNISFYFVKVPEAPNIAKQISIRLKNVIVFLQRIQYRKCVIFCNQSHTRILTTATLQKQGYSCALISSRLSCESRKKNVSCMVELDKNILVAADVISRGVHIESVDLVINIDLPSSKEAFLHRSGRTGRYGKKGICISICTETEIETLRYLEYALNFKCQHVTDITDVASDCRSMSTKREYVPDSWEIKSFTNGSIASNGEIKNLSSDTKAFLQPADSRVEGGRNGGISKWKQDEFTTCDHDQFLQEDNFDLIVRETLISSIQNNLFPGSMKHHVLNALGVISCFNIDNMETILLGIKTQSYVRTSNASKDGFSHQIRFTEHPHRKVLVHVSKSFHDYIDSVEVDTNINDEMCHIIVEQEAIGSVAIFNKEHNMFCSTQSTLLITVRCDIKTLQSLREISAMKNVEFIVSEKMTVNLQSIDSSYLMKQT